MVYATTFKAPLTYLEVYRTNRIRLAKYFQIDPRIIDEWDAQTYYDALEVRAADEIQETLTSY